MGFFKNVNGAWEMKVALSRLVNATNETEFRAHLPAAEAAGDKIWGSGSRLIREGSAKDKVMTAAAAAPTAAKQFLGQGQFFMARQVIVEAMIGLDQLYG